MGGPETPWPDIYRIIRRFAEVDSSLAHLFGFQHLQVASVALLLRVLIVPFKVLAPFAIEIENRTLLPVSVDTQDVGPCGNTENTANTPLPAAVPIAVSGPVISSDRLVGALMPSLPDGPRASFALLATKVARFELRLTDTVIGVTEARSPPAAARV